MKKFIFNLAFTVFTSILTLVSQNILAQGWTVGGTNTTTNPITNNVGIGITTPVAKLDVNGRVVTRSRFTMARTGYDPTTSKVWNFDNNNNDLRFFQEPNISTAGTVRMIIKDNGNIGIATEAPTEKLHIIGNVKSSDPGGGHVTILPWDGNIELGSGNDSQSFIDFKGNTNLTSDFKGRILHRDGDGFYINSNGANTLNVNGRIRAKEIKVELVGTWADYVFAPDYKLRPLEDLEKYISENHHLPNVPPAAEIECTSIDIASMMTTQMEKIEELTLYMIEMNQKVETLQRENEILKQQICPPFKN